MKKRTTVEQMRASKACVVCGIVDLSKPVTDTVYVGDDDKGHEKYAHPACVQE